VIYVPANSLPTYESRFVHSTLNLVSELRSSGYIHCYSFLILIPRSFCALRQGTAPKEPK
jgi:hypothetical protein